ncbi:uncharacterized protein LOC142497555 isoform X2 [Ascaphus truei]|uniref:uncharacterized protein LOC142497555 isoform X2 n=1 Tax=Ascaphus truei TaxID=8439 RepID=UPI003F595F95
MSSYSISLIFTYCLLDGVHWTWDLLKPEISWEKDPDDEREHRITCTAPEPPEEYRVIRFFLHKNKSQFKDLNTKEWSLKVTFPVSASDPAIYKCSYVLDVLQTPQHHIESPLSDPLQPTKEDKDAKDGDEDGLHGVWTYMIPVISAVCAILILILVVIIVCYFSRKRKTSQDTINNSVLPINDQMATEKEATYASVDEMKNSNVDVVMQKADNDDDDDDDGGGGGGITYATLNMEALSMKKVSSSSPVESSLYAAVRR